MKKYLLSIIMAVVSIGCFITYNLIGSEVLADGILSEPFYLIPLGYIFAAIAVISALILFIKSFRK